MPDRDLARMTEPSIEHAQCRRHAPWRVSGGISNTPGKVWPHVNANDWCGEHELMPEDRQP